MSLSSLAATIMQSPSRRILHVCASPPSLMGRWKSSRSPFCLASRHHSAMYSSSRAISGPSRFWHTSKCYYSNTLQNKPDLSKDSPPQHSNKKEGEDVNKPDEPTPPQPLVERIRAFFKKYGKVGLAVYFLVSSSTFVTIYSLIHAGVDVAAMLEKLGVSMPKWSEKASTLLLTYTLYKILLPIRLMLAAALTPYVMRYLKRINWIK